MQSQRVRNNTKNSRRHGAALMEVLIAIMAMGIGVVSLMSLFPLAVIRSVQGHQLTVGSGHRLNAEALLDSHPYIWVDPNRNGIASEHAAEKFIFDPLGWANNQLNPALGTLNRYHAGFSFPQTARRLTVYDGNWIERFQETAAPGYTATSATVPGLGALGVAVTTVGDQTDVRAIIFDISGKFSHTRTFLSGVLGNSITWTQPLPAGFLVGKIRIESLDGQFSWMLTCRRHDIGTKRFGEIYVTEFFRREFPSGGDPVFLNTANFGFTGNLVFKSGQNSAYLSNITPGNEPPLRRGSFIFDVEKGYWHKIADYEVAGSTVRIQLEKPALVDSTQAVFMRGIADVYYLGSKTF